MRFGHGEDNYRQGGNSCFLGSFFCMFPRRGQHLPKVSFIMTLPALFKRKSRFSGSQRIVLCPCHWELLGWGWGERWGGGWKRVAFTLESKSFQNVICPQLAGQHGPVRRHQRAQVLGVWDPSRAFVPEPFEVLGKHPRL